MLPIAGKPVMEYILDDLASLGDVTQVVYITGHLKEKVEEYARSRTNFPSVFIEQKVQDGTAGAVALARGYIDQPVLIVFVDTIFDADLSVVNELDADGVIWVKEVEDYQRFGVVVADADGNMTRIIEKPGTPISKRANIGLYYVRDWKLLFEGIAHVLSQPKNKGEWYLTDAFQYMIDHGAKIRVIDVQGWYDAGKLDSLLETNRVMLERGRARRPAQLGEDNTVVEPVFIEDGAVLRNSRVGPNVTIGAGSVVEGSELSDSIIGTGVLLSDSRLHHSMVGNSAVVRGVRGALSVGDHSEVMGEG
jgi:glucose-1-phosphate thymidylyltransferase